RDDRQRVSGVSRGVVTTIKGENCAAMLLSQLIKLKREYYNTEPTVGDLRETGQLENDAHVVALIHRGWGEEPDASGKMVERVLSSGKFIVPKNRGGDTGAVNGGFNRGLGVFTHR